MAKRYGRNQRRRHRDEVHRQAFEINDLQHSLSIMNRQLAERAQELRDLERMVADWDADIRQLLHAYSAFRLKPAKVHAAPLEEICRLPIPNDISSPIMPIGSEVFPMAMASYVAIKRLVISSEKDHTQLRQIVRVVVKHPNGSEHPHFAYAIDGQNLMTVGRREWPYLAEQVAKQMMNALRGA